VKPVIALLLSALLVLSTGASLAADAPTAHAPPAKVVSVEGITEYRLANGLRVLLFPDVSKPTLTTNIVYMVGSRHENYGETGMAHLLEHLLFKPSANFGVKPGSKTPVEALNAIGGRFNGTTWYDRTNYFATFPANDDNLRLLLSLEADRMVNAAIDQKDLWNAQEKKGKMTVVRNEFELGESDPARVTMERMRAVAYDWHNYGKSTIGARSDIEQVDIAHLRAFYQRYYQPDNAVLMLAGKFEPAKALAQVDELFGRIPRPSRVLDPTYTAEPAQDGERSVTVRRSGGAQFVGAGYHTAPSAHPDSIALYAVGAILTDTPSGRLYKALVETKLATSVFLSGNSNLEPGYAIFGATVPKDGNLDLAQEAMLKVLEGLKSQPITSEEVARVKQQFARRIELTMNNTASLTLALTESLAVGDWRMFFLHRDQAEKLDVAAVQAAAEKYLKTSNRTVGRFIPTDAPDRVLPPATPDVAALVKDYTGRAAVAQGEAFDATPANIEARLQRFTLQGGLRAALLAKKTKGGSVSVSLELSMGTEESLRGKATVGFATANMLNQGTAQLSRQQIKDTLDKLKSQVSIGGGAERVFVTVTSTRENLAATLDVVAQELKTPGFPAKEFQEQQLAVITGLERSMPEPAAQASQALSLLMDETPSGHVHHSQSFAERIAAIKAVTVDDVKAFHASFYGGSHIAFSAVGDFDADALKSQLATLFGDWKSPQPYVRVQHARKQVAAQRVSLETPDKANSILFAFQPLPIKDDAPQYPALLLANRMLGGGALRSRLADRIRQKEGLSYGVGSQLPISALDPTAMWLASAISAPQNNAKVEAALREELQKALDQGFTDAEVAEAKKAWKQSVEVSYTQDGAVAGMLRGYLNIDRTMAWDQALQDKVAALSTAQINQALRDNLKPQALSIVRAGDFAKAQQAPQ
jgi:zinc protease